MVTLVNRAKMTTATTGTGPITLGSAIDGYQSFADAGVVDGDEVRYTIEDETNWEIGTGTYTSSGTALTRTVDESSDGGTAISLSGNAVVFVTAAGDDLQNAADMDQGVSTTDSPEFAGLGGPFLKGVFRKADATEVAWTKTGNDTAETQTDLFIEVNDTIVTFASGTSITMPSLSAGTDYAIWAKPDGGLEATSNHTSPPVANARKVGGFHYAPGGNAPAQSGGDTTPQINEYSFYDLKWKPACSDPRGMTLVGGGFWVDIYLTGVDAITNGSSAYNVTIADGSSPPKVPAMFGGNGSTTYGGYTWFEAQELATAFGKRTLTQIEFMAAAYGTTEETDGGSNPGSTILRSNFTSKWGVILATGNMWVWGRDRGGAHNTGGWNANTEGRGSEYNAPNAVLFGGDWIAGFRAGSRCSYWSNAASASNNGIGSRFACDHLTLE